MIGRPESLDDLALGTGTDKSSAVHGFAALYDSYLRPMRDQEVVVLEIGVYQGASLRMWRDYFPHGVIWGLDVEPLSQDEDRIVVVTGDQRSPEALDRCAPGCTFDLVVDDGGHMADMQQLALLHLWPRVKPTGYYILEDTFTSYMTDEHDMSYRQPGTTVEFLKDRVDDVNAAYRGNWLAPHFPGFSVPASHEVLLADLAVLAFHPGTCVMQKAP